MKNLHKNTFILMTLCTNIHKIKEQYEFYWIFIIEILQKTKFKEGVLRYSKIGPFAFIIISTLHD